MARFPSATRTATIRARLRAKVATQFKSNCPHCLSKSAGFTVTHQWYALESFKKASVLAVCGVCNNAIIIKVGSYGDHNVNDYRQNDLHFPVTHDFVEGTYPTISMDIPNDCPSSVERFYVQGIENLRGNNWDAAGAMFRKSLDVATKLISPADKKETLFHRIEKLVERGLLTPAMGDWSHELRLDGNEAVHDEDPETKTDAEAMQKFAEAFLRYSFTLPRLVETNRAKREA